MTSATTPRNRRRRVGGRSTVELLRALAKSSQKEREAEHEQQIADDAACDRRLDQFDVTLVKGDNRNDELCGVSEGCVEEPTERWTRSLGKLLGPETNDTSERDQRGGGREEDPLRPWRAHRKPPRNRREDDEEIDAVGSERLQRGADGMHGQLIREALEVFLVGAW